MVCGFMLGGVLLCSGCAPKGYITAAVQTVIGLDVSENPQTQVPHIRFGFIRSQLYYIPTGASEPTPGTGSSPSPSQAGLTPELVSDIDVDITFLNRTTIKERFAVGPSAVRSGAAQLLFAPPGTVVPTAVFIPGSQVVRELRVLLQNELKLSKAKEWIAAHFPNHPQKDNPDAFIDRPPGPEEKTLRDLLQFLQSP